MPLPLLRPQNPLARAATFWLLFLGLLFLQGNFVKPFFPPEWERIVYGLQGMIAASITWYLFAGRLRAATFPRRHPGLAIVGTLAGSALTALLFLFVYAAGGARIHATGAHFGAAEMLPYIALFFLAWMEEIAFRGYPFRLLQQRYGMLLAQLIVALAFAAYHIASGWPPLQALLGPGIWSVFFGIAAARSGGIALPTGLHFGINVMLALMGAKAGYRAFWVAEAPPDTARLELAGFATQAVVLIISLWLTFRYRRRAGASQAWAPESRPA